MPDAKQDSAGVVVPPPVMYALGFAVGYAIDRWAPVALFGAGTPGAAALWRKVIAWVLIVAAGWLMVSAILLFRDAGTSPIPHKPVTALVVHGPYRFTRNPMYLGFAVLYLGVTLLVNSLWPLVLLPIVLGIIHRWVIVREEAYLTRAFGDDYRAYQARVRRWL